MSPYQYEPLDKWPNITARLVQQHPLSLDVIRDIALSAWSAVWSTQIGSAGNFIPLRTILPPATVVGYFFEKLFAHELALRYPTLWRGSLSGAEKDLHHIPDNFFSIEVKSSGQLGLNVYGNRSYGKELMDGAISKKDKSGYYITVNFYRETLVLIRFGWIDGTDWQAQKSETGQMAGLPDYVYANKLIPIRGEYTLQAPVGILRGMGPVNCESAYNLGIFTVADLLHSNQLLPTSLIRGQREAQIYAAELAR